MHDGSLSNLGAALTEASPSGQQNIISMTRGGRAATSYCQPTAQAIFLL